MHMHVHFIASHRSLIDVHFPNMETVADLNLYFDGTRVYTAVACSFTAFDGSYAPAVNNSWQLLLIVAYIHCMCHGNWLEYKNSNMLCRSTNQESL